MTASGPDHSSSSRTRRLIEPDLPGSPGLPDLPGSPDLPDRPDLLRPALARRA